MKVKLVDYREIATFPSSSGIEFHDGKLYLVGDDAKDILVLNKRWKELERLPLFESVEERIPKATKADLEATTVVTVNRIPRLLILGSGSKGTARNRAILLNLDSYLSDVFDISPFYQRLVKSGIKKLNIECAATIEDHLLLGSRGNRKHPENHLIITKNTFWKKQQQAEIVTVPLEMPMKSDIPPGISGLTYSQLNDCLLFTASTEATDNAVDDGAVGDSFLGIIANASRKIGRRNLTVDEWINLSEVHELFKGFKIESVCIQSEKQQKLKLHMAADNDTGKSYLFKVRIKW